MRKVLGKNKYSNILEIGSGTGKNTKWLLTKAKHLTCLDFSDEMLNKTKEKIKSGKVNFIKQDIEKKWNLSIVKFDLIVCSLILEHVENINFSFKQAFKVLKKGGIFYIGELHPFKQYLGSKARFESGNGTVVLNCYVHNISDFIDCADKNNFQLIDLKEWYDDKQSVPRLLTSVFKK